MRCWGRGDLGQLGYGNTSNIGDNELPASAGDINVGDPVKQIALGESHTCALLTNGAVRCWGSSWSGVLGYGDNSQIGDNEPPASAGYVNVGGPAQQIAAGSAHTCVLLTSGRVRCWGYGAEGRLGYGNTNTIGDNEFPAFAGDVDLGGSIVKQIGLGRGHTCALVSTGPVRCWGRALWGEIGYGTMANNGDYESPATAGEVNVGGAVQQLAVGPSHTCALLTSGATRCWGYSGDGQLGYGNYENIGDDEHPVSAGDVNVGSPVRQLVAGSAHTCALLTTGAVRCWGKAESGQLGYGNTTENRTPASAGNVNVGGTVQQLAAGFAHTCALLTTGAVRCWGDNFYGQLGYGNTNNIGDNETPASAGDVPFM
ncbi:MAG TPA: hypothetical protein VI072_24055 [Polyangiaceae bacterium]